MRSLAAVLVALAACHTGHREATITWQAPLDIARGGGTKGPWQQNESHFDYVDDPSVALAADGSTAVVWVDQRDKDIHFQRYAPDGRPRLPRPTDVSRTPAVFSWLPRVVVANDAIVVLWQEIVFSGGSHGGDIFVARSTDDGASFGTPVNLSRSVGGDGKGRIDADTWQNGSLDLALAPDGTLYAAWTEYDGPLWLTSSRDGGATFSTPQHVAGSDAEPARAPALAIGRDGAVFLAWTNGENPAADIHLAVARNGRFGSPTLVARTPTYSDAPKLAFDPRGTLHVVYAETDGGPFARSHVHYTQSRDGGRTFAPSMSLARDATYPSLATNGDDVFVVWDVIDDHHQPRGLGLASSPDRGKRFVVTRLVPDSVDPAGGTNGSQQGRLMARLATRDGYIAIVTASLAAGSGSRVWMLRGRLARP